MRRRTPRLPEPEGPRTGRAGAGPRLRLLVAGDSSAAGVGAGSWEATLTAVLVARLTERFSVAWRLEAATGATTPDTLRRLEAQEGERFDVLVTALGVNDVTRGTETEVWLDHQRRLFALARERFGVQGVVVSGLPPVGSFPALPWPLRPWLGRRARRFDAALRRETAAHPWARYVDLNVSDDVSDMASDGFHPGPPIYAAWAAGVADEIESWAGSWVGDPLP